MTDALNIEWWPIEQVRPYRKNPRICPDSAVGKVAASIREFGFKTPMLVTADGDVIAGHTRLQAAQRLKLMAVPVIVCSDLTDAQSRALRLADNRTGEETQWEFDLLNVELQELADDGFDVSLTGFDPDELAGLSFGDDEKQPRNRRAVTCPECGHEFVPGE